MQPNILILAIVGVVVAALIIFLVWKNKKDRRAFNPDSQDAVDNLHMDQEKDGDKV
ncbi:FeoB-associated Cys-rich membrane protein [Polluticoccus soli]|uniref:FeoB-associated Cys-rich membrane protein n=1 Tax=Polluticoccus soli TaxID=3034150 RepID=UPI0023E238D2|nr:FeoB-associated Cys-rich membrane protein [Flavipsychrobacter sp. JY13-12]